MKKPAIAVDLDDVLGDENGAMISFINETYGARHTIEDYYNTNAPYGAFWEKVWGVDNDEAKARYQEYKKSGHKNNHQPLANAIEVLSQLKERFRLVIITARGEDSVEATHSWLNKHYPGIFEDIHFMPLWQEGSSTKAQIGQHIGISYLIDDSPEHCKLAAEVGIQALLFGSYGWNKKVQPTTNLSKVKDWNAVARYFNV